MNQPARAKVRIGVLVPFTNTNLEADMALVRQPEATFHFARIGGYDADAVPDSDQMAGLGEAPLEEPLRLLCGVRPHVVMYGCTSATLTHGPAFDRDLADRIKALSGAGTVTAAGSLVNALKTLGISRAGFASPYVARINDQAIEFLANSGIETVSRADYPAALDNYGQGALTPDEVFDLALRADSDAADAIILSCTDMRALETIERLEQAMGKPVISSNQAMLFSALELAGISVALAGFGVLLSNDKQGRNIA